MNFNKNHGLYIGLPIIILITIYITACPSMPRPDTTRGSQQTPDLPRFHVWDLLKQEGGEVVGYGMYTYVLFGLRVDRLTSINYQIIKRYENLLDAITRSTPTVDEARTAMKKSNIFYLPSNVPDVSDGFYFGYYNSSLAMSYISRLANMIKDDIRLVERFTNRPGPFLISTLHPLGVITEDEFPLLYADLSVSNPAAMNEIVSAYKRQIRTETIDGLERFHPLRLRLLNLILNADDDLKIVRVEAAEWKGK